MSAGQLFENDDLWELMEAVAREVRYRHEAHAETDKTAKAAIEANGAAYNDLSDAVAVWRRLARVPTANAGHDDKFDPAAAVENARNFLAALEVSDV